MPSLKAYSASSDESAGAAKASKRTQVSNACASCRAKKVKCSGKTPRCIRCEKNNIECVYDAALEGMTRMNHLKHQLTNQTDDLDLKTRVLGIMRHGSDLDAVGALARLRFGQSLEQVMEGAEGRPSTASQSATGSVAGSVQQQEEGQMVPPFAPALMPGGFYDWQAVYEANERAIQAEVDAANAQPTFSDAAEEDGYDLGPGMDMDVSSGVDFDTAPYDSLCAPGFPVDGMYPAPSVTEGYSWTPQPSDTHHAAHAARYS